jgi:hypothetical protein
MRKYPDVKSVLYQMVGPFSFQTVNWPKPFNYKEIISLNIKCPWIDLPFENPAPKSSVCILMFLVCIQMLSIKKLTQSQTLLQ